MTIPNDEARCHGWPQPRDTVRPCEMCQGCMRWQSVGTGGERNSYEMAPAVESDGVVICGRRMPVKAEG